MDVGAEADRKPDVAPAVLVWPFSLFSSSMIGASMDEDFRLLPDWLLTFRPSISMLPLFENSMLLVVKSSLNAPVGMLISSDKPSRANDVLALFVSCCPSLLDSSDEPDLDFFKLNHRPVSFTFPPALCRSRRLSSCLMEEVVVVVVEEVQPGSFTRICGRLAAADVRLLTVGAFVLRLV